MLLEVAVGTLGLQEPEQDVQIGLDPLHDGERHALGDAGELVFGRPAVDGFPGIGHGQLVVAFHLGDIGPGAEAGG